MVLPRRLVTTATILAALVAGGACSRTVKVTPIISEAKALSDVSAQASIVMVVKMGVVYEAEKPPRMPPNLWWVTDGTAKGVVGGQDMALYPLQTTEVRAGPQGASVHAAFEGPVTRRMEPGTPAELSRPEHGRLPAGWSILVVKGVGTAFVRDSDFVPR